MALNLSDVSHAPHAESEVLSVEGSSDGAGDGGLTGHTGTQTHTLITLELTLIGTH